MSQNNTKTVSDIVSDKHLYELLRRKETFSEYIDGTYAEHVKNLVSEVLELEEEIEKKGSGVAGEVMDVVYMVGQLLNKMNRDGLLEGVDFSKHKAKILHRSPNLKKGVKVDRKTENIIWQERKKIPVGES